MLPSLVSDRFGQKNWAYAIENPLSSFTLGGASVNSGQFVAKCLAQAFVSLNGASACEPPQVSVTVIRSFNEPGKAFAGTRVSS